MNRVIAYPQPGKAKSAHILDAFAKGAGGEVSLVPHIAPGPVAFYGCVGIEHILRQARFEQRDWYYGDNAYFDAFRKKLYRFSKNDFQKLPRRARPNHEKMRALGLTVQPWRNGGKHIVVVEQSPHFLDLVAAPMGQDWLKHCVLTLQGLTRREIVVRRWQRDKDKARKSLHADLKGAHALVTHMSAAANEAVLAGVPVFVSGLCAAEPMASGGLDAIETPKYPEGREEWAALLCDAQWTLDEIRAGVAWGKLND